MQINEFNYEEFFLLYVDNELPAAQKREVELFAAMHPELNAELELLRRSKLMHGDETFSFGNKSSLFKTETSSINLQKLGRIFFTVCGQ